MKKKEIFSGPTLMYNKVRKAIQKYEEWKSYLVRKKLQWKNLRN